MIKMSSYCFISEPKFTELFLSCMKKIAFDNAIFHLRSRDICNQCLKFHFPKSSALLITLEMLRLAWWHGA